jgi:FixJ family two-component response regulator
MSDAHEVVFVVDDDASIRTALGRLLRSRGRRVETFASVDEFLAARRADTPGCLLLDLRLPGTGGLELHEMLRSQGHDLPVVFITGFGDVESSVRAMKAGAVDFLSKPFDEDELLRAVDTALARGARARSQRERLRTLAGRYAALSARERQVFDRVAAGLLNKQIAAALGVSEKTVKVHRAHVMAKLQARSVADLVRISEWLSPSVGGVAPPRAMEPDLV